MNVAMVVGFDGQSVKSASITLGAVAPTIIHAAKAESYLLGRELTNDVISEAAELTRGASTADHRHPRLGGLSRGDGQGNYRARAAGRPR